MGPKPNKCPHNGHTCEDGIKDCVNVAPSQGLWGAPESWRRQRGILPWSLWGELSLTNTYGFHTPEMNFKIIHLCCCKPPSSWYCVMADPGSLDRWHLKCNFMYTHLLVTCTTLKWNILRCFEGRLSQARLSFSPSLRTGSVCSVLKS